MLLHFVWCFYEVNVSYNFKTSLNFVTYLNALSRKIKKKGLCFNQHSKNTAKEAGYEGDQGLMRTEVGSKVPRRNVKLH